MKGIRRLVSNTVHIVSSSVTGSAVEEVLYKNSSALWELTYLNFHDNFKK